MEHIIGLQATAIIIACCVFIVACIVFLTREFRRDLMKMIMDVIEKYEKDNDNIKQ